MAIALDIINRALRLAGVLQSGESAEANEAADALTALNDMLADWSAGELLTQHGLTLLSYSVSSPITQFTIGPTGDLVTERPYSITSPFTRIGGYDYPIVLTTQADYLAITQKDLQAGYPEYGYYDASLNDGTLYLWPAATAGQTIYFNSDSPLSAGLTLYSTVNLPANYIRALAYNLAVEIAPEYGQRLDENVHTIAATSKRNIKRANASPPTMISEAGYLNGGSSYNILNNQ